MGKTVQLVFKNKERSIEWFLPVGIRSNGKQQIWCHHLCSFVHVAGNKDTKHIACLEVVFWGPSGAKAMGPPDNLLLPLAEAASRERQKRVEEMKNRRNRSNNVKKVIPAFLQNQSLEGVDPKAFRLQRVDQDNPNQTIPVVVTGSSLYVALKAGQDFVIRLPLGTRWQDWEYSLRKGDKVHVMKTEAIHEPTVTVAEYPSSSSADTRGNNVNASATPTIPQHDVVRPRHSAPQDSAEANLERATPPDNGYAELSFNNPVDGAGESGQPLPFVGQPSSTTSPTLMEFCGIDDVELEGGSFPRQPTSIPTLAHDSYSSTWMTDAMEGHPWDSPWSSPISPTWGDSLACECFDLEDAAFPG